MWLNIQDKVDHHSFIREGVDFFYLITAKVKLIDCFKDIILDWTWNTLVLSYLIVTFLGKDATS